MTRTNNLAFLGSTLILILSAQCCMTSNVTENMHSFHFNRNQQVYRVPCQSLISCPVIWNKEDFENRKSFEKQRKKFQNLPPLWFGDPVDTSGLTLEQHHKEHHKQTRDRYRAHAFNPIVNAPLWAKSDVASTETKGKKCAIVGNSGILLGQGHGKDIDSHDVIVRFHSAPIKGYESDVGTKTSIRFLSKGATVGKHNMDHFEEVTAWWDADRNTQEMYIVRSGYAFNLDTLYAKMSPKVQMMLSTGMLRVFGLHDDFYNEAWGCLIETFAKNLMKNYRVGREIDLTGNPSTGWYAAMFGITRCASVTLYGYGSVKNVPYKYYIPELKCCSTSMHDMAKELTNIRRIGHAWLGADFQIVRGKKDTLKPQYIKLMAKLNDRTEKKSDILTVQRLRAASEATTGGTKHMINQRWVDSTGTELNSSTAILLFLIVLSLVGYCCHSYFETHCEQRFKMCKRYSNKWG